MIKEIAKTDLLSSYYDQLKDVRDQGFILTRFQGDTGVGATLEHELGIESNSESAPDLDGYELKSARSESNAQQTLFSYCRLRHWKMSKRDVVLRHGIDKGDRINAYNAVKMKPNKNGLYYEITDNHIVVKSGEDIVLQWTKDEIVEQYHNKFPSCLKVFADSRGQGANEHFHYNRAYAYKTIDKDRFFEMLKSDEIYIDLRLWMSKSGVVKDHGTSFRCTHRAFENLFEKTILFE